MDSNINTDGANNQKDTDIAEVYDVFKKRLLTELGADKMSEEDRIKTEEGLENLVNARIVNLLMIYVPEEKAEELNKIVKEEDQEKMLKFINDNIPGFGDKAAVELMKLREELLGKLTRDGK